MVLIGLAACSPLFSFLNTHTELSSHWMNTAKLSRAIHCSYVWQQVPIRLGREFEWQNWLAKCFRAPISMRSL